MELSVFMKEQQAQAEAREDRHRQHDAYLRQEAKAEKVEMEGKMEQLRQEAKTEKAETEAKMEQLKAELTPSPPAPAITQEQLAALQSRIDGLHVAKLLADEELYALEDTIADYVELTMSMAGRVITREMIYSLATVAAASKLDKLVGLSAVMVGDAAFARQARRKFLQ